jgi:cathepsin H
LRDFEQFRTKHEKVYEDGQLKDRIKIFCQNRKEIAKINSAGKSWTAGINEYSDLSWEEFKDMFTMKTAQNCSATSPTSLSEYVKLGVAPKEMDWRNVTCGETSCVSMVKNQGKCGR